VKLIVFLSMVLAVSLFTVDAKALDVNGTYKELTAAGFSDDVVKEISKIPDKPHFLLGLERKYTHWDKFQELRKMFRTVGNYYQPGGGTLIDRQALEYNTDNTLQETVTIEGKKVQVVYLGYHEINGMTVIWTKLGEKNLAEFSPVYEKYKAKWALGAINDLQWSLIQKLMGWAQFEAVKSHIHNTVSESAKENAVYYKSFDFVKRVMEARAKMLDDPDYINHLNDKVNGNDIKVDDIISAPRVNIADFLPDLFFVGLGKFDGGLAYWKVNGSEQIVYVSLQSLMYQYIKGNNYIVRHELTHTNSYLQSFVWGMYFDVETWAETASGFLEGDPLDFLFHPYYAHWRDLAKIYFGYDSDEIMLKVFPGRLSGVGIRDVNRQEFEANAKKVEIISNEINKFFEDFLVDFYAEPFFWTAVNTKFCDNAAAVRIRFALQYEPAGLFDPNKKDKDGKVISPSVQTKLWLLREEESGKLDRLAEYAMKNTGTKSKLSKEFSKFSDGGNNLKCPVNSMAFLMSSREREQVSDALELLISQAKAGNGLARHMLIRIFGNTDFLPLLNQNRKEGG